LRDVAVGYPHGLGEQLQGLTQLVYIIDAHHAVLGEDRGGHRVVPGDRCRVRRRGLLPVLRTADLKITIGLPASRARRAASRNFRPSLNPSTTAPITRIRSSSTIWLTKSAMSRSASLPGEHHRPNPRPRSIHCMSARPIPPPCVTSPTGPLVTSAPAT